MEGAHQFHVGMVVDDLDAAMAELSELFGYTWCPPMAVETPVRLPGGDIMLDLRFAYSATTPRVEVVRSVPGTPWMPADSGLHHVGYWSDDLAGDAARPGGTGLRGRGRRRAPSRRTHLVVPPQPARPAHRAGEPGNPAGPPGVLGLGLVAIGMVNRLVERSHR